jgi:hypothetical protein
MLNTKEQAIVEQKARHFDEITASGILDQLDSRQARMVIGIKSLGHWYHLVQLGRIKPNGNSQKKTKRYSFAEMRQIVLPKIHGAIKEINED